GAPSFWSRATDSGRRIACAFCPACGSRLWHEPEDDRPTLTVKAGSLDEPVDLSGAVHIWTKRKLPGVVIPDGARQFAGEPG
ncbi:MAG TPA: GFA family protein, partial [Geminicoccaceae bacterium]|nr:GFA family protein [Geminicoccaceae bacterium]